MIRKYFKIGLMMLAVSLYSCGGGDDAATDAVVTNPNNPNAAASSDAGEASSADVPASQMIDLENKGVGPFTEVVFEEEIDEAKATEGKNLFNGKGQCFTCHRPDKDLTGPAPKGVYERRTAEWVGNMIINTNEMLKSDPLAKALLEEYGSPMTHVELTEEETLAIMEYFRTL